MFEDYIEKIIISTDDEKMHELKDVLIDIISYIQRNNPTIYNKIECDLYEIVMGKVLDENMAKEWVNKMQPKARWTLKEIEQLKNQYQFNLPTISAYVIMNMLYSDFGDILGREINNETLQRYIQMAEDWYYDEDSSKTEDEKLYCYWKSIIN